MNKFLRNLFFLKERKYKKVSSTSCAMMELSDQQGAETIDDIGMAVEDYVKKVQIKYSPNDEFRDVENLFQRGQRKLMVDADDKSGEESFVCYRFCRRRRAFTGPELRSEISELKNILLNKALEECNLL